MQSTQAVHFVSQLPEAVMARRDVWETHTNSLFKPPPSMRADAMPASSVATRRRHSVQLPFMHCQSQSRLEKVSAGQSFASDRHPQDLLHREPREGANSGRMR